MQIACSRWLVLFLLILQSSFLAEGAEFQQDDSVLILVTGPAEQSVPWGLSGKCSLYLANQTTQNEKLGFAEVKSSVNVPCERRSAKKVTEAFDYTSKGQIPPGIYFVSYHRLDPKGNRHRIAIGDAKAGTTIKYNNVTRTFIQFHQAANNLAGYTPQLSEGCIIFNSTNFSKLFPKAFLDPANSPLEPSSSNLKTAKSYQGKGRVLVFVTDVTNRDKQKRQIALFDQIRQGSSKGLTVEDFKTNAAWIKSTREEWSR